jgi:phosphatidylglycerol---prolipoprotein diacylglyceryl transferase
LYPRLFQFGHFAIPTYGAFTALALVAALAALLVFARRLVLDANKVWNLGLIAILTTLIAARLLLAILYFRAFRQHPMWVLGLAANRTSFLDTIAVIIGFSAAILYALAEGLPILRTLDCIAPSAALAVILNRIGAFLAGLDYGLPEAHGWSVTYTSRLAALWYHTPLGVRLYPVQLYESIASLTILAILLWWLPRRRQDGELWGAWLFLSGLTGFFLAFYRAANQTQWTLQQPVAVVMVVASAIFLLQRKSVNRTGGYTEKDDSLCT